MTDKDRLLELLEDWDIPVEDSNYASGTATTIIVKDKDKVQGYSGFYVDFDYDNEGNFVSMGIWE